MPDNSGNVCPGCWPRADAAEAANRPRAKLIHTPGADGRTAIGGILYTFLSAYTRLAPSGLRRFILPLPSIRSAASRIRPSCDQPALTRATGGIEQRQVFQDV